MVQGWRELYQVYLPGWDSEQYLVEVFLPVLGAELHHLTCIASTCQRAARKVLHLANQEVLQPVGGAEAGSDGGVLHTWQG